MDRNATTAGTPAVHDVLVLGGGFGGLHMVHALRERGFSVIGLEAGENVGGAWYWNRYPGARCDVESLVYCYSFSPIIDAEWRWPERYSGQKDIRAYMSWVADRLDLRKHFRFNSRLVKAHFDKDAHLWTFATQNGDTYQARWFVAAPGPISAPIWPDIPGRETFRGELLHTALWPHEEPVFAGKRVGVIGTGSSGTQLIPIVAEQAEHLTVFLRTPNFTAPARNRPLTDEDYARWETVKVERRRQLREGLRVGGDTFMPDDLFEARFKPAASFTPEQRREILERQWAFGGGMVSACFADVMTDQAVNDETAEFFRSKIREVVKDTAKAELLSPRGYAIGTKRTCVDTGYYETYNRDNVEIVSVKQTPIERFTERGVVVDGKEIELDVVICASGFDALTGALTVIDIRGRDGQSIADVWADGPHTYLGLAVNGFPNMLMIGGPGSPSVLTNVVMTNECQVEWIADTLTWARENGVVELEAEEAAQEQWTGLVGEVVKQTLFATSDSWYVGANVPGKKKVILAWTGGIAAYLETCNGAAAEGYKGFARTAAAG